eukprot:scaffold283_cov316-Pavlova_lutheri.AAC.38
MSKTEVSGTRHIPASMDAIPTMAYESNDAKSCMPPDIPNSAKEPDEQPTAAPRKSEGANLQQEVPRVVRRTAGGVQDRIHVGESGVEHLRIPQCDGACAESAYGRVEGPRDAAILEPLEELPKPFGTLQERGRGCPGENAQEHEQRKFYQSYLLVRRELEGGFAPQSNLRDHRCQYCTEQHHGDGGAGCARGPILSFLPGTLQHVFHGKERPGDRCIETSGQPGGGSGSNDGNLRPARYTERVEEQRRAVGANFHGGSFRSEGGTGSQRRHCCGGLEEGLGLVSPIPIVFLRVRSPDGRLESTRCALDEGHRGSSCCRDEQGEGTSLVFQEREIMDSFDRFLDKMDAVVEEHDAASCDDSDEARGHNLHAFRCNGGRAVRLAWCGLSARRWLNRHFLRPFPYPVPPAPSASNRPSTASLSKAIHASVPLSDSPRPRPRLHEGRLGERGNREIARTFRAFPSMHGWTDPSRPFQRWERNKTERRDGFVFRGDALCNDGAGVGASNRRAEFNDRLAPLLTRASLGRRNRRALEDPKVRVCIAFRQCQRMRGTN